MANSRLNLHEELCKILGSRNVYYNPPESIQMKYPCFRYSKAKPKTLKANNGRYAVLDHYEITVMSADPDNNLVDLLLDHFETSEFDRTYISNNLYHNVLSIYYHKED